MGGLLPPAERRSSVLVGIYTAVSLLLLSVGDRIPTQSLRGLGAWLFAPLDRIVLVVDRLGSAWRENRHLHERIARLELESARLRVAGQENARLRALLALPPWRETAVSPVEILALAGEPVPTGATVSRGARQGVHTGDVVVTQDGLLGRVVETWSTLSRVALITDPNSAIACEVESTGVLGVLRPVPERRLRLVLTGVPLSDTVVIGQRVVTSGFSSRYPRGILVGSIAALGKEPSGLTQVIEVEPAARLSRLRHGFVIPGRAQGDAR